MSISPDHTIAKFGGTSMARPDFVLEQLAHDQNDAQIVVVSAPGHADPDQKVTQLLRDYALNPSAEAATNIQSRYDELTEHLGELASGREFGAIVRDIPTTLNNWYRNGSPVDALGEYWSGRLFAIVSGRKFLDPRDIIKFGSDGDLDHAAISAAYHKHVTPGQKYVIPGYYGADAYDRVKVLPAGGSDITGSELSAVSKAEEYHNWSDVPGLMSANPKIVNTAQHRKEVTYREIREVANGGSELLHRTSVKLLGHTDVVTVLRDTFGDPDQAATRVVRERDWQQSPIVAVSGQAKLLELSLNQFGLNEGAGRTVDLFTELQDAGIPYEHAATGTDDISVFLSYASKVGGEEARNIKRIEAVASHMRTSERSVALRSAGMVHIVGEGLAKSGTERMRVFGMVALALADAGIEGAGATDVAGSAAITLFVKPEATDEAVRVAHQALQLGA